MSTEEKRLDDVEQILAAKKQLQDYNDMVKGMLVRISEDKMIAYVELSEPLDGKEYTVEDVLYALQTKGVKKGISKNMIRQMLYEKQYYQEYEVAVGREPQTGHDGEYQYFFNTHPRSAPKILEDGSVDYRNMECFESVVEGQLIAEYHPETEGIDGYNVCGEVLKAKRGRRKLPIRGRYIRANEDQTKFFSDADGRIEFDDETEQIRISTIYVVEADVDASTGNIKFNGDLEIHGGIMSGYVVEATGSIIVDGIVEAATIKAGKNVMLKRGMNGNGKGFVIAGGNVEGRYFERTNIDCNGYVHANSIMDCYIECKDEVVLSGSRGVLLAGRVYALCGITAVNIGNEAQIPTHLKVGLEPKMRYQYDSMRKKMDTLERNLQRLSHAQLALSALKATNDARKQQEIEARKLEIMRAKITSTTELERLKSSCKELEYQIDVGKKASVTASQWVYAGTSVTINGATNNVKEDYKRIIFSLRKGNVIMSYYDD